MSWLPFDGSTSIVTHTVQNAFRWHSIMTKIVQFIERARDDFPSVCLKLKLHLQRQ